MTIAVLVDRWTVSWPAPAWSPRGVAGIVPLIVCALPFATVVAVFLVGSTLLDNRGGRSTAPVEPDQRRLLLPVTGALGLVWMVLNAGQIVL